MKYGVICVVYDDPEYLEMAIECPAKLVDRVLILINDKPWNGDISDNSKTLEMASLLCAKYPNVSLIRPNLCKPMWKDEVEQRNHGLALLSQMGIDIALIIDADEIYSQKDFSNAVGFIESNLQYSAYHIHWDTYWKKSYHVIRPQEKFLPTFAVRVANYEFTEMRMGSTSVVRSGATVLKTAENGYNAAVIPAEICICHHLSYARTDEQIQRKIETFSHCSEIHKDWYDKVWLEWRPGNTDLHPVTPSQYKTAVNCNVLNMPPQLVQFIKRERMSKHGCTIVIPNWNSKVLLERCLNLINTRTSGVRFEVIVVDNGSKFDGSVEYLKSLESQPFNFKLTTIYLPENLGFAGGVNVGMRQANPNTDIVLFNVDAEPAAGWLTSMYDTLLANADAGMVGPLGNNVPSGHQKEGEFQEDTFVLNLHFFCVLISRELIKKMGVLDPRYLIGGYDDNDYGSRARFAKFGLYVSANSLVTHEAHQVFEINGLDYYKYDGANLFRFAEKMHKILYAVSRVKDLYEDEEFNKEAGLFIE